MKRLVYNVRFAGCDLLLFSRELDVVGHNLFKKKYKVYFYFSRKEIIIFFMEAL